MRSWYCSHLINSHNGHAVAVGHRNLKKYQDDMFSGMMFLLSFVKIGQLMYAILIPVVEADEGLSHNFLTGTLIKCDRIAHLNNI